MTYELAWRHLHDDTKRASEEVRRQMGHNLKSSLQYTYRQATLDDPFYPTAGYAFRCAPASLSPPCHAPYGTCHAEQ